MRYVKQALNFMTKNGYYQTLRHVKSIVPAGLYSSTLGKFCPFENHDMFFIFHS